MIYLVKSGANYIAPQWTGTGYLAPNAGYSVAIDQLDAMGDAELAGYGFVRVNEPPSQDVPFGKRLSSISFSIDKNGVVTAVQTLEDIPLADLKAQRLVDLANRRWAAETGGMTFAGFPLASDPVSQTKYVGAAVAAILDPNYTLNWKLSTGDFVALTHDQIVGVASAVRAHVQDCFDNEKALAGLIDAATTVNELGAISLETGWPS